MSEKSIGLMIFQGIIYTIAFVGVLVGLVALTAVVVGWLLPIATLGAFAPGFIPSVAIVTLGLLARALVFQSHTK